MDKHKTYLVTKISFQEELIVQSDGKKINLKVVIVAVTVATLIFAVGCSVLLILNEPIQLDANNQLTDKFNSLPQQSNPTDSEPPNETLQPKESNTVQSSNGEEQTGSSIIAADGLVVYSDISCAQPLTSITWGEIIPGDSVQRTIYIKNSGSNPLTLSLSASNWNPANAPDSLTMTWDKQNVVLAGGQLTSATITLSVASTVSGISNFGVIIVITGC